MKKTPKGLPLGARYGTRDSTRDSQQFRSAVTVLFGYHAENKKVLSQNRENIRRSGRFSAGCQWVQWLRMPGQLVLARAI
jgi:hypothetical protein